MNQANISIKLWKEKNSKDQIINYLSNSKGNVNIGYNPIQDSLEEFLLLATVKYCPITLKPSQVQFFPVEVPKQIALNDMKRDTHLPNAN
jgi:hypothetical protein